MVLVIANFLIHEYCMEGKFLDNVTHKVVLKLAALSNRKLSLFLP